MATTLSTTSNFQKAHVDAYIQKKLQEIGAVKTRYEDYATKKPLPQGEGQTVRFNRYQRLDQPLTTLSEGVTGSDNQLALDFIEAVAAQYGNRVTLTDVSELTLNHSQLQQAIMLLADDMRITRDRLIQEALMTGTNVFYGGGKTSRDALTTADVIDTTLLRRIDADLDLTDGFSGAAPGFKGEMKAGVLHKKHNIDLMDDDVWEDMAQFQDKESLERGMLKVWNGIEWKSTNYAFELQNTGATAALATNGGTIVASGAGSTWGAATQRVVVTRQHKKRGFEELISQQISIATLAGENVVVTIGSGTGASDYVYNVSVSETNGSTTTRRQFTRVAAGSVNTSTGPQASGTIAPVHPGTVGVGGVTAGFKSYVSEVFGAEAFAEVDLAGGRLDAGVTPAGRTIEDPYAQLRKVSYKFFNVALILNDNWVARIEAPSSY
jgi:N4-gp56 family major capsid protein